MRFQVASPTVRGVSLPFWEVDAYPASAPSWAGVDVVRRQVHTSTILPPVRFSAVDFIAPARPSSHDLRPLHGDTLSFDTESMCESTADGVVGLVLA